MKMAVDLCRAAVFSQPAIASGESTSVTRQELNGAGARNGFGDLNALQTIPPPRSPGLSVFRISPGTVPLPGPTPFRRHRSSA